MEEMSYRKPVDQILTEVLTEEILTEEILTEEILSEEILTEILAEETLAEELLTVDGVLQKYVGELGPCQIRHAVLVACAWSLEALFTFIIIFTERMPAWHCTAPSCFGKTLCQVDAEQQLATWHHQASQRENATWQWSEPASVSVVSEWGLICGQQELLAWIDSGYFMGYCAGSCFFAFLSDGPLGRKRTLLLASLLASLLTTLTALAPSPHSYALLRLLTGIATSGLGNTCYVLAAELIGPSYRGPASMLVNLSYPFGQMLLPALAAFASAVGPEEAEAVQWWWQKEAPAGGMGAVVATESVPVLHAPPAGWDVASAPQASLAPSWRRLYLLAGAGVGGLYCALLLLPPLLLAIRPIISGHMAHFVAFLGRKSGDRAFGVGIAGGENSQDDTRLIVPLADEKQGESTGKVIMKAAQAVGQGEGRREGCTAEAEEEALVVKAGAGGGESRAVMQAAEVALRHRKAQGVVWKEVRSVTWVCESPKWLLERGGRGGALQVLQGLAKGNSRVIPAGVVLVPDLWAAGNCTGCRTIGSCNEFRAVETCAENCAELSAAENRVDSWAAASGVVASQPVQEASEGIKGGGGTGAGTSGGGIAGEGANVSCKGGGGGEGSTTEYCVTGAGSPGGCVASCAASTAGAAGSTGGGAARGGLRESPSPRAHLHCLSLGGDESAAGGGAAGGGGTAGAAGSTGRGGAGKWGGLQELLSSRVHVQRLCLMLLLFLNSSSLYNGLTLNTANLATALTQQLAAAGSSNNSNLTSSPNPANSSSPMGSIAAATYLVAVVQVPSILLSGCLINRVGRRRLVSCSLILGSLLCAIGGTVLLAQGPGGGGGGGGEGGGLVLAQVGGEGGMLLAQGAGDGGLLVQGNGGGSGSERGGSRGSSSASRRELLRAGGTEGGSGMRDGGKTGGRREDMPGLEWKDLPLLVAAEGGRGSRALPHLHPPLVSRYSHAGRPSRYSACTPYSAPRSHLP
ncbi:unnamed protein product [Closterium sp. Naga37s-1]|nr:unnamed protein product [Closterium sp. Naga37s-1]